MSFIMLLISTSLLFGSEPMPQVDIMSSEAARSRLQMATDESTHIEDRLSSLDEIISRCQDDDLVASAEYQRGVIFSSPDFDLDADQNQDPLASALNAFLAADTRAISTQTRSRARYNIGYTYYLMFMRSSAEIDPEASPDLQAMISTLKDLRRLLVSSAGAFGSVWEVDSSFKNAAENLERVRLLIRKIDNQIQQLENMEKQQQEQNEQKQRDQQEAANALDELADQQSQEANESSQSPENPEEKEQHQEQQTKDQGDIDEQTSQVQSELSENGTSEEEIDSLIDEAKEAQEQAQEKLANGDLEGASKDQQRAAEKLKEASKAMQELADQTAKENEASKGDEGNNEEQDPSDSSEDDQSSDDENGDEPSEQINDTAKELLDKERREREARQRYRAKVKPVPVERDW